MWCLVVQPSNVVLEIHVPAKAKGQELLEKACEILGMRAEMDYLGLKLAKGTEESWLNLRNPIERQAHGIQPYRFLLRVKFWVPPHLVLQPVTRHIMYTQMREDLEEGRLEATEEERDRLTPFLLDAENSQYLEKEKAEYWALKEASTLEGFGEEVYSFKNLRMGIGPAGVSVNQQDERKMIPYSAIRSASNQRRLFQLVFIDDDHEEKTLQVKCDSNNSASGMYRAVTERHDFYSCDTVRGAVTSQCIRDFKGTIASIFNESTPLGKKYVFDLRLTCREVHDNARRALYTPEEQGESSQFCQQRKHNDQETLKRLLRATTCAVCMDEQMDTAFFPCGHVVCCSHCAEKLTQCPLCRATVDSSHKVYLPTRELALEAMEIHSSKDINEIMSSKDSIETISSLP